MNLPTHLTEHARLRLRERTRLTPPELIKLFSRDCTVSIGFRGSGSRQVWLRLFFSPPDREHFIGVQRMRRGHVVTIVPTAGRRRITDEQRREAILKALQIGSGAPAPGLNDSLNRALSALFPADHPSRQAAARPR